MKDGDRKAAGPHTSRKCSCGHCSPDRLKSRPTTKTLTSLINIVVLETVSPTQKATGWKEKGGGNK